MKHKYLYVNPRGFRNEFTIYRVPVDKLQEAEEFIHAATHNQSSNDNLREVIWIPYKEAMYLTARERANERENRRAGLTSRENPVGATAISDWNERSS